MLEDETRLRGLLCEPTVLREVQGRGRNELRVSGRTRRTVYWWAAFNAPANELVSAGRRKQQLLERYREWPFGITDAIEAMPEEAILQNDLVDRAPARSYARGHIVLVGDAAHPTTPNLGQGTNMAIDDAIVLARALTKNRLYLLRSIAISASDWREPLWSKNRVGALVRCVGGIRQSAFPCARRWSD